MPRKYFTLALALVALFVALTVQAQTPTGAIEGTVTDQSSAAVPGAKVTITEVATKRTIELTSNDLGRYSQRNLVPGLYNVRVEAPSFATRVINSIQVDSGAVVNGDVRLEVGGTQQIVEVTAEAVQVDTSRQTVDTVVTQNDIKNLPLFSRNFLDLASLAPGVVIRDGGAIDPTKTFAYRTVGVSGRSGTGTRVQIDGIDVTDETVGTTTANLSDEAVSEFQLQRSSLDISTSLTSSGAINVITKSGGNDFHGSWFYDYFNQDMGARLNYEAQADDFHRKRTGGSVGGPFKKDKLFWFANYERTYQTSQAVLETPTFPQQNVHQPFPTGLRYAIARVDWIISPTLRAFYKFDHDWNISTGGSAVSPFQNIDWTNTHTMGLDINQAHATNSIRFGYVNFNNNITSQELEKKFPIFNGVQYNLAVGAFASGPNGLAPQATYQDNHQISYDGSYIWNRHTFRYGGSFNHIALGGFANFAGPLSLTGQYDAGTVAAIQAAGGNIQDPLEYPLTGFTDGPANGFFTLRAGHGLAHGDHINNRTAIFGGDSIKVSRNFTLNIGVRWEYDSGMFNNDHRVKRDPVLDTWGKGFSAFPSPPKNLFSPSLGFAWDPKGNGRTSIRGGFYKAYEMNIYNNLIFDEFAMLPPGLGPDVYDNTGVFTPNGTPIDVDGKHPNGDYSDLVGQPIKNTLPTIIAVDQALKNAYATYKFDPNSGKSAFVLDRGLTFGGVFPGNQFKVPYAIQANIGVQHEIKAGTVISVDYVFNHGVGLPFLLPDFERRRDAATLDVAAAQARINTVTGGMSVSDWLAANPGATMNKFRFLNSDAYFTGLTPDFVRARFLQGGFTKYQGLQVNLRGRQHNFWKFRDPMYNISYAYGHSNASNAASSDRAEFLTGVGNNHNFNDPHYFGPTDLDYRHILNGAEFLTFPGGFRINTIWHFRTVPAGSLFIPDLGGGASGSNQYFTNDANGDLRVDLLPELSAGNYGRSVHSISDVNKLLQDFNSKYAGQITAHGQALIAAGLFTADQLRQLGAVMPTIPLIPSGAPNPWHHLFTTDLRFDRPIKFFHEGWQLNPYVDIINLFNHAPSNTYGGLGATFGSLNYDYTATPGQLASDLASSLGRNAGLRQIQLGVRFDF